MVLLHRPLRSPRARKVGLLWGAALLLSLPCPARADSLRVEYPSTDGFRIAALYYRPAQPSARGILILPDPAETKERWTTLADSLRDRGFHVLVPDLRGTGESLMQRGTRRDRARFTRAEADAATLDGDAGFRYLRDLPATTIRAVAIVGSGHGIDASPGGLCHLFRRTARLLVSPNPEEGRDEPWKGLGKCAGPTLLLCQRRDLRAIEAAAAWIRHDSTATTWMIDGEGRGLDLLLSRPDMVHHWLAWLDQALGRI